MITKLGTLISEYSVRNKLDEDIPVYSVTNEQGFCTGYFSKDVASKDRTTYKIVPRGYFAYNPSRINVGSVDWQNCEDRVIVSPLYVVFGVNDKLDQRYLLHYLKSDIALTLIKALASGSVRDNLKFSILSEFPINLRSIEEQQKIADTLDRIDRVIKLREEEIETLDNLVKSRFIELFGDPESNPMHWETKTFRQAGVRLSDGPFGSNLKSEHYVESGVRVIRLGNIGVGRFINNDQSYISEEHYEKLKKYTCRAGDVIIGTLGEPNLRACLVPETIEYAINKADCVHYIPRPEMLNKRFVCQYINCPETLSLASGMVHGQTRSRISSGQLAEMPIFIPPMELQEQFAAFVEQTDKSKLAVQKSLEELEILKKSLMQQYFG